jgi:hypothetical protein
MRRFAFVLRFTMCPLLVFPAHPAPCSWLKKPAGVDPGVAGGVRFLFGGKAPDPAS